MRGAHSLKLFKMGVPNYKSYDPVNVEPVEQDPEKATEICKTHNCAAVIPDGG